MRIWLYAFIALMASQAAADVLVPFKTGDENSAVKVDPAARQASIARFRSKFEKALAGQLQRPLGEADRPLLSSVERAVGRSSCEGAVWLGRVSNESFIDAIVVCGWEPHALYFGDGRPPVTNGSSLMEGCQITVGKPCAIEVTPLPNRMPGVRDIHVRSGRGCYLFHWEDPSLPATLGAVPCKETPAEVVARRDTCLADGGRLVTAFMRGSFVCTRPTKDAGRSCTDGRQCEGRCVPEDGVKLGEVAVGKCSATSGPADCRMFIQDGRVSTCANVD